MSDRGPSLTEVCDSAEDCEPDDWQVLSFGLLLFEREDEVCCGGVDEVVDCSICVVGGLTSSISSNTDPPTLKNYQNYFLFL